MHGSQSCKTLPTGTDSLNCELLSPPACCLYAFAPSAPLLAWWHYVFFSCKLLICWASDPKQAMNCLPMLLSLPTDGDRLHGAGSTCIPALQGCCRAQCWPLSHVNASKRADLHPLPRAEEIRESDIGTGAGLFEVLKIGDEFFTFIVDCKQPKACSILLRGASKDVLNEVRSACDAAGLSTINILCPVQNRAQCSSGTCRVSGSVH